MESKFEKFKKLHTANDLFILPNAWTPGSAILLEQCNYPAVGTSSSAVAASLGYSDGEGMPFEDYLFVIKRIAASVSIPVTIDMEMGYGKTDAAIYDNLRRLVEAGVVGINIEDSTLSNGKRVLKPADRFAETVAFLKDKLVNAGQALFINVRCDTFIAENMAGETFARLKLYEAAGADGIFLPFISKKEDITQAVAGTKLPLNVMCIHGLPEISELSKLGVKRVSMGPFLHNKTYSAAKELAKSVLDQRSLKSIL
ncbi:MAG: isocitrate lyase/phosphoenolpyruvate mutase family protein [Bacteroidota bacterium]